MQRHAELAGGGRDAALIVPAQEQAALQDAFERLFTEQGVATALRKRGLRQARRFSWEKAAKETLEVYESAVSEG